MKNNSMHYDRYLVTYHDWFQKFVRVINRKIVIGVKRTTKAGNIRTHKIFINKLAVFLTI